MQGKGDYYKTEYVDSKWLLEGWIWWQKVIVIRLNMVTQIDYYKVEYGDKKWLL